MASPIHSSAVLAVSLALLVPFGTLAQSAEPSDSAAPAAAASTAATDASSVSALAELDWQRFDGLPGPTTALANNMAVGADGTLAVLGQTAFGEGPGLGWSSSDGVTWEPARFKGGELSPFADLLALPDGGFIAWPYLGAQLWRSPDGRTWKRDKRGDSVFFGDGIATEDGLLFVGQSRDTKPAVLRSTDGKEWSATELPAPEGGDDLPNLIVRLADGTLLAAATGTRDMAATVWRSLDGADWQVVPMPDSEPGAFISGIAATTAGAVMVVPHLSETGIIGSTIWATSDGADWQEVHREADVWLSGPVSGPGAVHTWAGPLLLTSEDGLTWAETRPEAFNGPYTVVDGAVTPDGSLAVIGRVEAIKGSATWLGTPASD